MSKKQLIKDNLLVFIGGNFANALNYLLNILLARNSDKLFNLYSSYVSVSLLLLIPSLVAMRTFTVFGGTTLSRIKNYVNQNSNKVLYGISLLALLLIPFEYFLKRITVDGTYITSFLLILLAIIGLIANIFRGIRQYDEDYKVAVLSINLEAMGRLFLGFFFAVVLNMGISGILLGHVLGLVMSLLVCYKKSYLEDTDIEPQIDDKGLKSIFFSSFIMTAGLEFISNFDIIFSNQILNSSTQAQTEFNTLQFFRKIIFFGIFAVSSVILSVGGKAKHTKRFYFIFTLCTGMAIGFGLGSIFFVLREPIMTFLLKKEINNITTKGQLIFLFATILMSTSYLLSNWLFTLKKKVYIFLPLFICLVQVLIFFSLRSNLDELLKAFLYTSIVFFGITFGAGLVESSVFNSKVNTDLDLDGGI